MKRNFTRKKQKGWKNFWLSRHSDSINFKPLLSSLFSPPAVRDDHDTYEFNPNRQCANPRSFNICPFADYGGIIVSPLFGPSYSQECVSFVNSRHEKRNMEIGWIRVYWWVVHMKNSIFFLLPTQIFPIFLCPFNYNISNLFHSPNRTLSWEWQHRAGRLPALEYTFIENGPAESRFHG